MSRKPQQKLRQGWTTGACATAATRAALTALITGEFPDPVTITLPKGQTPAFALAREEKNDDWASASIIKDAGDDPDVTHGVEIGARLSRIAGEGIEYVAGVGVGTITKPGRALSVGEPAINPVPRRMIATALREVFPCGGFRVEIFIPAGEARALKTMNARLGIIGGLSILGTTGIVRPISHKAWTDTLEVEIDVALASGSRPLVLSTGRSSEAAAVKYLEKLPEESFVMMGDHIGYCLEACARKGVPRLVLAGQFAKLIKIACGHPQTHVRNSRLDLGQVQRWAEQIPLDPADISRLELAHTARDIFVGFGPDSALIDRVATEALNQCRKILPAAELQILLVDYRGTVVRTFTD
ncbi:MAG: cobalt-precorrin-5B (C(1))-methyltransferase [Geopsychrobacter sp.]|nr:cobalt-precorrin-5B (C(1))-methyltransferase [Geopsychrobacter sp.]